MNQLRKYKFTIPGRPVGKQSVRTVSGHSYIPAKSRDFMNLTKMCAQQAGVQIMERVSLQIVIFMPYRIKKYKTKPDVILEPLVRPDISNIYKAIEDGLKGIAYKDDKHILDYGDRPRFKFIRPDEPMRVEVEITEVEWEDYIEIGS